MRQLQPQSHFCVGCVQAFVALSVFVELTTLQLMHIL